MELGFKKGKYLFVPIVMVMITLFSLSPAQGGDVKPFYKNFYLELGAGGVYQHRKPIELIQPQDETAALPVPGKPFTHEIDDWAPFGKGTLGYLFNKKLSFELNFVALYAREKTHSAIPGGANLASGAIPGPSNTSIMPFLDGVSRSGQQGAELGGQGSNPNATTALGFNYKNNEYDLQLDINYSLTERGPLALQGLFGVGYTYFYQRASFNTKGIDYDNGRDSLSSTSEKIKDDLVGLRGGVKGKYNLFSGFYLNGSIVGSLYYRMSKFNGSQDFANVSLPFTGIPSSFSIKVRDVDKGFAPRLSCKIGIGKNFNSKLGVELFYNFESWWNMSMVDNPTVYLSGGADLVDHPARIGTQTVYQHFVGAKLVW